MNLKQLLKSFRSAFSGIKIVFKEEQNFRIQLFAAILVFILSFYFKIKTLEALVLVLIIVIVLMLELINSVFERISDILKPRMSHYVKVIKDIMAGAVLIASICAVIIGIIIFGPYLLNR